MFHVEHPYHILLINPWITDFAAYNLWVRPLGLLRIGSFLRQNGLRVTLIDCLDQYVKKKHYGDGKFLKMKIDKPSPLKLIPRTYSRYGMTEEVLSEALSRIDPPHAIGVTSGMTYWYPGVLKTIQIARKSFKRAPIVLGGIYATLCYEHASRFSEADLVIRGKGEAELLRFISSVTGHNNAFKDKGEFRVSEQFQTPNFELQTLRPPYPCFDLYAQLESVCVSTSRGCPFECSYCASRLLDGSFSKRDPLAVVEEITYWNTRYQVKNITFYDDALLIEPHLHIIPILKEIVRRKLHCNFHAPNGLHIREIDEEIAYLLFASGFKTIRLGLETSNEREQKKTGGKVGNNDFRVAVKNLRKAGFSREQIGTYILVGLPDQWVAEVEESIRYVWDIGARPLVVEYSPVPGTPLFERAKKTSRFDLEKEPLFQNKSVLPCQWQGFTLGDYRRIKTLQKQR